MKINKKEIHEKSFVRTGIISIIAATIILIKANISFDGLDVLFISCMFWLIIAAAIWLPLYGIVYFFSLGFKRVHLKINYLDIAFKKVKIDFGNNEKISNKILRYEDIQSFARKLNDEIIEVKVIFKGIRKDGKEDEITRIYQFKDYEINFLEVED